VRGPPPVECYDLLHDDEQWARVELDRMPRQLYRLRGIYLVSARAAVSRRGNVIELVREEETVRTWTIPTPGAQEEWVELGAATLIFLVDVHQLWILDPAGHTRIALGHVPAPAPHGKPMRLRLDPGMNLMLVDVSEAS